MRFSNKKSLLNKATLMLVLLFLISAMGVSADITCDGLNSYNVTAGQAATITAHQGSSSTITSWEVLDYGGIPPEMVSLSNQNGCEVDFQADAIGTFTLKFSYTGGSGETIVNALSSLETQGFGHNCYAIDTSNCGDIKAYGDVIATNFIDANEVIAQGRAHSYGSVTVGDYLNPDVSLTPTLVQLPDTVINDSLGVYDYIYGLSSAGVTIGSDLEALQSFYAFGPSYLYQLMEISNPSGIVAVTADLNISDSLYTTELEVADSGVVYNSLDVLGVAVVDNLSVSGEAMFDSNVRILTADKKFLGPVNLRPACDAVSPRMYQDTNGDFVIELGTTNACGVGEPCIENADCSVGTCQDYVCYLQGGGT